MKILGMVPAALMATATAVSAQNFSETIEAVFEEMQEKKNEKILEVLQLDEDSVDAFRDVYEEYQWALEKENEKFVELVWEYLDKSKELNDERARAMIQSYLAMEEESAKLKRTYMTRFADVLTPLQLVHLFQIENKAEALIKHRVATYIPFLE